MQRRLSDAVVVITGASGGIGRATAEAFARKGCAVVLAARREPQLQEVARQCRVLGARTRVVPTDVTEEQAVQNLARQAIENFGRIDVWVNNAGVSLFGRFEECPSDVYRRVIDTNLFGYIHGARAALPYFREQGHGTLIKVASVVASAPQPYTSAYVTSKFGIRGFTDCLRMELALDGAPDIHLCTVLPATIDTPLFQHAANYTGRAVRPMPPVYPPEKVADAILELASSPQREVYVGSAGCLMAAQYQLAPAVYDRLGARLVDRNHLKREPADPTPGNVLEPISDTADSSGGWQSNGRPPVGALAAAGLAAAVPLAWWAWQRSRAAASIAS